MPKKDFKRLPTNVAPKHYSVCLTTIDLDKHLFDGQVTIKVDVNQSTKGIQINASELVISEVIFRRDAKLIKASDVKLNAHDEIVDISFESPLDVGEGQLEIKFSGVLHEKMKGFYRSKQGDGVFGASTHFEPTGARLAFPCWDEPALKATFDISLTVPENKTALSNMAVRDETLDQNGYKTINFKTTPRMSTYLVAFVVGDFDFVEDTLQMSTGKNLVVRVYTPAGKMEQGRYALTVAKDCLALYNDYFGIDYPLEKCDLIAISDFPIGAMENWGLVTFRETRLLCDPQNTSSVNKQNIALVIGHELAHMWFGNLVTMDWWTDLWLKEGFAEFIMYMSVGKLYPEMETWSTFVADILGPALELDALNNSHPIEVEVGHPSEVSEIFDTITYNKGASIIRMLHAFIGTENFKNGLRHYLNQYQYGNAVTVNLWESLEKVSNRNVGSVMSTWTKQKGFPVVKVIQRREPAEKRVILDITQSKFSMQKETSNALWSIPITLTRQEPGAEEMICLLEEKSSQVVVEGVNPDDWIKINVNAVGFYHVLYESSHLQELLPAVESKTLSALDRWSLQNDLFALVQAGEASTVDVLKLMKSFVNEDDYTVWASVDSAFERLDVLLTNTNDQNRLHAFGREIFQKIYATIGWNAAPGESHARTLLRSMVIGRLGGFGDENVLNEAVKRFDAHVDGSQPLSADLRSAVYQTVIHSKRDHIFDALIKIFRKTDMAEEKVRIARALGCVSDQGRIEQVLEFAMSSEIRLQDTRFVLFALSTTMNGRNAAWAHFKANCAEYRRRYEGNVVFGDMVKCLTENYASESKALEVEEFFETNPIPGTERSVNQAVEKIRIQAKWLDRDLESIRKYLA